MRVDTPILCVLLLFRPVISTTTWIVLTHTCTSELAHTCTHQPIWKISDKVNMKLIAVIELFFETAVKRRATQRCDCDCDCSPLILNKRERLAKNKPEKFSLIISQRWRQRRCHDQIDAVLYWLYLLRLSVLVYALLFDWCITLWITWHVSANRQLSS